MMKGTVDVFCVACVTTAWMTNISTYLTVISASLSIVWFAYQIADRIRNKPQPMEIEHDTRRRKLKERPRKGP